MRRRARISPSFVISLMALTLAAGGLAFAAIPSSDGTIKACYARTNGLLLGIPHSKGDVRVVDETEGCRSYEKAISWNQKGLPGEPGSAAAYARVAFTGAVVAANSRNVTAANVTKGGPGTYCIGGLAFTPRSAVVTAAPFHPTVASVATVDVADPGGSLGVDGCTGQIVVHTHLISDDVQAHDGQGFTIWIED